MPIIENDHKSISDILWCKLFLFLLFFTITKVFFIITKVFFYRKVKFYNCSIKLFKNILHLCYNFIYVFFGCNLSLLFLSIIFGLYLTVRIRFYSLFEIMKHEHERVDSFVTSLYSCLTFLLYELINIVKVTKGILISLKLNVLFH